MKSIKLFSNLGMLLILGAITIPSLSIARGHDESLISESEQSGRTETSGVNTPSDPLFCFASGAGVPEGNAINGIVDQSGVAVIFTEKGFLSALTIGMTSSGPIKGTLKVVTSLVTQLVTGKCYSFKFSN